MVIKHHSSETGVQTSQKLAQKPHRTLPIAIGVCCSLFSLPAFALSESDYTKPSGWSILENDPRTRKPYTNVHVYKNLYEGSMVALVDVPNGARVDMMQYQAPNKVRGFESFYLGDIKHWWNQMPTISHRVLVVNGQYFDPYANPTILSFSIKDDGHVYPSSDPNAGQGKAKQLNIYPNNNVTVVDASDGHYKEHHAPTAIVGMSIKHVDGPRSALGRTHLCAMPTRRGNNVLLIYVAQAKTQEQAAADLMRWGCYESNSLALDGSASSQLYTRAGTFFRGVDRQGKVGRKVPQAIGIYDY